MSFSVARSGFFTFEYRWIDRDSHQLPLQSYDRRITSLGYTLHWQ